MAELEISKHTKSAWKTITSGDHGFWHKVRETILEIAIIVFAVSFSIWMHEQGEHKHEQQQVKTFLLELRTDIQADIDQIHYNVKSYHADDAIYGYLTNLNARVAPDQEKFNEYYEHAILHFNRFFGPHRGKYEGFKSSGKLTTIENKLLLNHIVNLYEEALPEIKSSEGGWSYNQSQLIDYLNLALDAPEGSDLPFKLIVAPKGKRLSKSMITVGQLYERYDKYEELGNQIIKEIDAEYPDATIKSI